MGIENNKAKSALRFSNNNLEVATLIATDERFAWEGRNFLSYDIFWAHFFVGTICGFYNEWEFKRLMTKDRIDKNLSWN